MRSLIMALAAVGFLSIGACAMDEKVNVRRNKLSFDYEQGVVGNVSDVHTNTAGLAEMSGKLYVYATFEMGAENPAPHIGDHAKGAQFLSIGEKTSDGFTPVVRFGVADAFRGGHELPNEELALVPAGGKSLQPRDAFLTIWLTDGSADYFGPFARPNTPCDIKIHLNLDDKCLTAWASARGDDEWVLLAENAPLINPVSKINHVQVEQYSGAEGISDLVIQTEKWEPGEQIRPHPLAPAERAVGPGRGFKFQSMRSVWQMAGRHVAVARAPGHHHAFGDVCQTGPESMVAVWTNMSHSGGGGGIEIAHSQDLGLTWSEPDMVHPGSRGCVRIQKLKDGSLLLISDDGSIRKGYTDIVMYNSLDNGKTWTNQPLLKSPRPGTGGLSEPSRILELADGSWLLTTSSYEGRPKNVTVACYVEVRRSTDRGRTWVLLSTIKDFPPRSITEPGIFQTPDGRLVIYSREWRYDALPGTRAISKDGGKTWKIHELPFSVTGRVCAGLLNDGRAMITFRSGIGRAALWAWIGDPDDPTGFEPGGAHFNDKHTVGLKDGALHIENNGVLGQYTQYFMRPADTHESTIDVTVEVKVVSNQGRAATLSVPYVGMFRIFPDRVEFAHDPSVSVKVTPGEFHVYRVVREPGKARLFVDNGPAVEISNVDDRVWREGALKTSIYTLAFGNEINAGAAVTNVFSQQITPEVTGYSIWRRVEEKLDDPHTGVKVFSWSAESGRFPDQYQLDHIIEVGATIVGGDQGYSGWVQLYDGRIFVINYTDDTAPMLRYDPYVGGGLLGITWMRGTYLLPSDLPPR